MLWRRGHVNCSAASRAIDFFEYKLRLHLARLKSAQGTTRSNERRAAGFCQEMRCKHDTCEQ